MKVNLLQKMIKVRSSLKKRCSNCVFARRGGILYLTCLTKRHNSRQGTQK